MNTAIGHLENIMELQQKQNTNKAQQKHYHTSMIYPRQEWGGFGCRCSRMSVVFALRGRQRKDTKEIMKYLREEKASGVRMTEEEAKKPNTKITQRPKCISRTL
jgi:hypothetical protein